MLSHSCPFPVSGCVTATGVLLKALGDTPFLLQHSHLAWLAASFWHAMPLPSTALQRRHWMLINRSRFLCALCCSPRQLSLCELSIILAEAAPVRQSPAVIRLLCGRGTCLLEHGDGGRGRLNPLLLSRPFPSFLVSVALQSFRRHSTRPG